MYCTEEIPQYQFCLAWWHQISRVFVNFASWFRLELYILTPHDLPKLHGCMDPTVASVGLWQVARALLICYIPLSLGEIWWQLWALRASDSCCPPRWNTQTNLQTGSCVPMHVTWYDTHMARTHHLFVFCLARFGTKFLDDPIFVRGTRWVLAWAWELASWLAVPQMWKMVMFRERWWCWHVGRLPCTKYTMLVTKI